MTTRLSMLFVVALAAGSVGVSSMADARPKRSSKRSARKSRKSPRFEGKRSMPSDGRTLDFRTGDALQRPTQNAPTQDPSYDPGLPNMGAMTPPAATTDPARPFYWFSPATISAPGELRLWSARYREWTPEMLVVGRRGAEFKARFGAGETVFITCGVAGRKVAKGFDVTHEGVTTVVKPVNSKIEFAIVGTDADADLRVVPRGGRSFGLMGCEAQVQ